MALKATPKDLYNRGRQQALIKAGKCLNGAEHAEPVVSPTTGKRRSKCEWCRAVASVGRERALELARENPGNPQPPETARYAWLRGAA
jgi:hypothetical protein